MTRPDLTSDVTVVLRKAAPIPVIVTLGEPAPAPPQGHSIAVNLAWQCQSDEDRPDHIDWDDPRTEGLTLYPIGADRTASVPVQNPGVYEAHVWLQKDGPTGGIAALDQKGGTASVRVIENGTASVRITIDADAMKKAIAELQKN